MILSPIDWALIASYFMFSLYIGLRYRKQASKSMTDFFVSGRNLTWWMAGTSMVATSFAADTPLAITAFIARDGLAGNWFWWAAAMSGMLVAFLYARMWRRSEVMTDTELLELRYSGKPAALLRGYRASYIALFVCTIVMGWVTGAMVNVLKHTVLVGSVSNIPHIDWIIIIGLLAATAAYTLLAGLTGVVVTDFFQFIVAMVGCIVLAVVAVSHIGGIDVMQLQLVENYGSTKVMDMMPSFGSDSWLPLDIFMILIFVRWWASSGPGDEPGGGGAQLQRLLSTKNEKEAVKAALWYSIANYCVRPWPWIIAAFAALAIFPELRLMAESGTGDPGIGYPMLITEVSLPGLAGLMLIVFFAAYMSTISSIINWGASFLVNDVYKRFVKTDGSEQHYAKASKGGTFIVLILGGIVAYLMQDVAIDEAWKILAALGAGTGPVFLLRWFWWRINAWTEISAMLSSLVVSLTLNAVLDVRTEYIIMITCFMTIAVWLTVTLLTKPEPEEHLTAFYRKVRPGGHGWGPIAAANPDIQVDKHIGLSIIAAMVASLGVFFVLGAIKYLIFFNASWLAITLGATFTCFYIVMILMRKIGLIDDVIESVTV